MYVKRETRESCSFIWFEMCGLFLGTAQCHCRMAEDCYLCAYDAQRMLREMHMQFCLQVLQLMADILSNGESLVLEETKKHHRREKRERQNCLSEQSDQEEQWWGPRLQSSFGCPLGASIACKLLDNIHWVFKLFLSTLLKTMFWFSLVQTTKWEIRKKGK